LVLTQGANKVTEIRIVILVIVNANFRKGIIFLNYSSSLFPVFFRLQYLYLVKLFLSFDDQTSEL